MGSDEAFPRGHRWPLDPKAPSASVAKHAKDCPATSGFACMCAPSGPSERECGEPGDMDLPCMLYEGHKGDHDDGHGHTWAATPSDPTPVPVASEPLTDEQWDAVVERVEDELGMGHGAWDMVPAREIARAFRSVLSTHSDPTPKTVGEPSELRGPITHELKVWPRYFDAIVDGSKTFEVRKNDREFRVDDTLRLCEWDNRIGFYSGREITRVVSYIVEGAPFLPEGLCVMGLRRRSEPVAAKPFESHVFYQLLGACENACVDIDNAQAWSGSKVRDKAFEKRDAARARLFEYVTTHGSEPTVSQPDTPPCNADRSISRGRRVNDTNEASNGVSPEGQHTKPAAGAEGVGEGASVPAVPSEVGDQGNVDGLSHVHAAPVPLVPLRGDAVSQPDTKTCVWSQEDSCEPWETACGQAFVFEEGGPDDNGMSFCCYCGNPLSIERADAAMEATQ